MGANGSVQLSASTPALQPSLQSTQQLSTENELTDMEGTTILEGSTYDANGEEIWLKQIQDLGNIIQNLTTDYMKLLDVNRALKQKCENLEIRFKEVCCEGKNDNYFDDSAIISDLKIASEKDKKTIEELKEQLENKAVHSAVELEEYHKNVNFMHEKVKEYEEIVKKLEKDVAIQCDMLSFQDPLLTVDTQDHVVEENSRERREYVTILKQEYDIYHNENKALNEQLERERNERRKTEEENFKLQEELNIMKQQFCSESNNKSIENYNQIFSEDVAKKETVITPSTSNCASSEEERTLSPRATAELEVFQEQIKVKREARHKALSAISMEMERLRKELNSEREVRRNAIKELENIRSTSSEHQNYEEVNDLKCKLSLERQAKDRIYKEMLEIQKQGNEEIEYISKELEKEKAKFEHILGENRFMKEQLEESDQMLQQRSEENNNLQKKMHEDREKYQQQVIALKDVVAISKEMLTVRENQVSHLKQTLQDIEVSVTDKNRASMTTGLRAEYETQMKNIKTLKALYEERMQAINTEKEELIRKQGEMQRLLEDEKRTVELLQTNLQEKEELILERNSTVSDLQDQLSDSIDQSRNLSYELSLINNMFTQILGSNGIDLDRLTKLLQENHDLITEITTKGECSETTASLPKLLLDLVSDAENSSESKEQDCTMYSEADTIEQAAHVDQNEDSEVSGNVKPNGAPLAIQDISSNLPKVWKVLLELVSHHIPSSEESPGDTKSICYKKIDTPYGPKNVISVSKTFLRLQDLILQKKSLQKEVTRLKQLNIHLETKLNDQENRLSLVSTELRKTWNVVDRMRIQHQQLHTHEKVLRYELQQKRKLLMELKEELEYCREKWEEARNKNVQSESDWRKLRSEFALRKNKPQNNSDESGFSEEKEEINSEERSKLQRTLSNTSDNKLAHSNCIDQNAHTIEDLEVATYSSSLPDLVTAVTDFSLSSSDVTISRRSNSPNDPESKVLQEPVLNMQSVVPKNSSLLDSSDVDNCSTVSLITLLKQQLSCFSKNLEIITTGLDANDHLKALQSIFSLPAIQIPDHIRTSGGEPSVSNIKKYDSNSETRRSVDRAIQCTEECEASVNKKTNFVYKSVSHEHVSKYQNIENPNSNNGFHSRDGLESITKEENNLLQMKEMSDKHSLLGADQSQSTNENVLEQSRSERLQRVEKQCQELFDKVTGRTETKTRVSLPTESKEHQEKQKDSRESGRNFQDILDARAARLKRLEEQSQQLFTKVTRTTNRGTELSTRLEELHEQYGNDSSTENLSSSASTSQTVTKNQITQETDEYDSIPHDSNTSNKCFSADSSVNFIPQPSTSFEIPIPPPLPPPTPPNLVSKWEARAARLKKLEEQSQQLFKKVTRTTQLSSELSNHLDKLHEQYGNEDSSRNVRISTETFSNHDSNEVQHLPDLYEFSTSSTEEVTFPSSHNSNTVQGELASSNFTRSEDFSATSSFSLTNDIETCEDATMVSQTTDPSADLLSCLEELHEQLSAEDVANSTPCTSIPSNGIEKQRTSDFVDNLVQSEGLSNSLQQCSSDQIESISSSSSSLELLSFSLENPKYSHHTEVKKIKEQFSNHIPCPPPLPNILPTFRLPIEIETSREPSIAALENEGEKEVERVQR